MTINVQNIGDSQSAVLIHSYEDLLRQGVCRVYRSSDGRFFGAYESPSCKPKTFLPIVGLDPRIEKIHSIATISLWFQGMIVYPGKGASDEFNRVCLSGALRGGVKSTIPFQPGLAHGSMVAAATLERLEEYAEITGRIEAFETQINEISKRIKQLDRDMVERHQSLKESEKKDKKEIETTDPLLSAYASEKLALSQALSKLAREMTKVATLRCKVPILSHFQLSRASPIDFTLSKVVISERGFDSISFNSQYISKDETRDEQRDKLSMLTSGASASVGGGFGPISAKANLSAQASLQRRVTQSLSRETSEAVLIIHSNITTRFVRQFGHLCFHQDALIEIFRKMMTPLPDDLVKYLDLTRFSRVNKQDSLQEKNKNLASIEIGKSELKCLETDSDFEKVFKKINKLRRLFNFKDADLEKALEAISKAIEGKKTLPAIKSYWESNPTSLQDITLSPNLPEREVAKLVKTYPKKIFDAIAIYNKKNKPKDPADSSTTGNNPFIYTWKQRLGIINKLKTFEWKVNEEEQRLKNVKRLRQTLKQSSEWNPAREYVQDLERSGISVNLDGEKKFYLLTEEVLGGSFTALVTFVSQNEMARRRTLLGVETGGQAGVSASGGPSWTLAGDASVAGSVARKSEHDLLNSILETRADIEMTVEGAIPVFARTAVIREVVSHMDLNPTQFQLSGGEASVLKSEISKPSAEKALAMNTQMQKAALAEANQIRNLVKTTTESRLHTPESVLVAYENFNDKMSRDSGCGVPIGFNYDEFNLSRVERVLRASIGDVPFEREFKNLKALHDESWKKCLANKAKTDFEREVQFFEVVVQATLKELGNKPRAPRESSLTAAATGTSSSLSSDKPTATDDDLSQYINFLNHQISDLEKKAATIENSAQLAERLKTLSLKLKP